MRRPPRQPARAAVVLVVGLLLPAGCSLAPQVGVPDVTNRYPAEAEATLTAAGLVVNYPEVPPISGASCGINGYAVTGQQPAAGSAVDVGATIDLTVVVSANGGGICGNAPATRGRVTVPDVRGTPLNEALSTLTALGLLVDVAPASGPHALTVGTQSPSGGPAQRAGTRVRLTIGR